VQIKTHLSVHSFLYFTPEYADIFTKEHTFPVSEVQCKLSN